MERERIEDAIKQWWSGGGTARRIVNVLEREDATRSECRFVAAKMAAAADRLTIIPESIIEDELMKARAFGSAGKVPVEKGWDGARCVFNNEPCPECGAWDRIPVVHGPLVGIGPG